MCLVAFGKGFQFGLKQERILNIQSIGIEQVHLENTLTL